MNVTDRGLLNAHSCSSRGPHPTPPGGLLILFVVVDQHTSSGGHGHSSQEESTAAAAAAHAQPSPHPSCGRVLGDAGTYSHDFAVYCEPDGSVQGSKECIYYSDGDPWVALEDLLNRQ